MLSGRRRACKVLAVRYGPHVSIRWAWVVLLAAGCCPGAHSVPAPVEPTAEALRPIDAPCRMTVDLTGMT